MALILGVDPAIRNTGVVVIDTDDNFKVIYQKNITNAPGCANNDSVQPYQQIMGGISCILHEFNIDRVFIERMFKSANQKISEMLFCAAFCIRLVATQSKVPFSMVSILGKRYGWKYFILGERLKTLSSSQQKKAARSQLEHELKTKFQCEHAADAACIALAGWYVQSGEDYRVTLGLKTPESLLPPTPKRRDYSGRKKTDGKFEHKRDVIEILPPEGQHSESGTSQPQG